MSEGQRAVVASVLATRGNVEGPFLAWLHSPAFADLAQQLGAFCRYRTGLSLVESELLILCVAAHHHCTGEQQIHEPIAITAGIAEETVSHLRASRRPRLQSERQELLYALATQLLRENRIEGRLYEQAITALGAQTLVEAVGVIGYYAMVAHTLNAFEMMKDVDDRAASASQVS